MRRPNALRRLRSGALDRRIAAAGFSVAAVALLVTTGVGPAPLVGVEIRDAAAARDLVALMRTGERGSWAVTFDFTRTLANGRELRQTMQEGRNPTLHVLRSGTSMTINRGDRTYDCNLVEDSWPCSVSADTGALPASEVLRVAVSVGAYDVTRSSARVIAGERARCFRVLTTGHGELPDLGVETDLCLAPDGVALRERVVGSSGVVDERVARSIARRVTTRTIEALAPDFDPRAAFGSP